MCSRRSGWTHYHTYAVTPAWNRQLVMTDAIGAHFFHRWRGWWGTTDDRYYARHTDKTKDSLAKGPLNQEYVCDRFSDFSSIPVPSWERSEEHTSELQSLMRISYAVFCLKKKNKQAEHK